jgi:mono/diheme cytochrome c family protein
VAGVVDPGTGKAVFENNCVYCHRAGPSPFRTEPGKIPELFGSGASGVHRFDLSARELDSLVDYLRTLNKAGGKRP